LSNATAISAGNSSTCALLSDGVVECWGYNADGELGNGTTTNSSIPVVAVPNGARAISTGGYHACAVLSSGSVECWGYNAFGELGNGTTINSSSPVPSGVRGFFASAVSAGGYHTCAVAPSGSALCWGSGYSGQLGNGTGAGSTAPVPTNPLVPFVSWTSSNASAATIGPNGLASWVGPGTSTIRASFAGLSATVTLTTY
jgi:alpha-tubulin suppressor-like RCC1 family protein